VLLFESTTSRYALSKLMLSLCQRRLIQLCTLLLAEYGVGVCGWYWSIKRCGCRSAGIPPMQRYICSFLLLFLRRSTDHHCIH
jgi:hypothetical protein